MITKELDNQRINNIEAKLMLDNIGINLADLSGYKQAIQDILSPLFKPHIEANITLPKKITTRKIKQPIT